MVILLHLHALAAAIMEAARFVYTWVDDLSRTRGRPVPLTLALFGGYRKDNDDSVLSLHTADAVLCLSLLCSHPLDDQPEVTKPSRKDP